MTESSARPTRAQQSRPTRAQQRRQTEERILAAARQIFAELGYDRTTIRAVASAAGVDAGLVMHYFGSKDRLFAQAAEMPAEELISGTTGAGGAAIPPRPGGTSGVAVSAPPSGGASGVAASARSSRGTSGDVTPSPPSEGVAAALSSRGTSGVAASAPSSGGASGVAASAPSSGGASGAVASAPSPDGTSGDVAEALLTSLSRRLTAEPTASLAVLRSVLTNTEAADRYRAAGEPQLRQLTEAIPTPDADLRASLLSAIIHGVIAERYLLRLTGLADAAPEQIIDLLRPCIQSLTTPPPTSARPQ